MGIRVFCIRPAADNGIGVVADALVKAAGTLADSRGESCLTHVLQSPDSRLELHNTVAYQGRRWRIALQVLREALSGHTLLFDHVHLAKPLLWIPRSLWPPVMIFAHGSESWRHVRQSSKKLFAHVDLVLCNSAYTKRRMEQHGIQGNLQPCPLGLSRMHTLKQDADVRHAIGHSLPFADGKVRDLGGKAILMVGRMLVEERRKGHWQLLEAMPQVLARHPDAKLVMAGTGNDRQYLLDHAHKLQCAHAVSCPGFVAQDKLEQLLASCAVFALPSQQEGFGLVYLEAMNAARPCIACENDGGAEVVVHEQTGLTVNAPPEPKTLGNALCQLLDNPEWAHRLGQNGRQRLHAQFTFALFQKRLISALQSL